MIEIRYLSVCSGIEAATAGWHGLGWHPAAFSEIDPFPRAVLEHHYPSVPLHGDFTTIKGNEYGTIDLLVGGTPCQSFSIAGLRKGLADDRGNLTLEFIRLAQRARPRWLVWENVPGVLSIDRGRAFGSFLGGLAECGYGFAYRILDAQYFGVPQRRRRVFVIGYLGDWRPAAAVLFEREGLRGDITPRREARERIADSLTVGANQCSGRPGDFVEHDIAHALEASGGGASGKEGRGLVTHTLRGDGFDASEDGTGRGTPLVAGTVSSKWAKGTGGPSGDECQNLIAFSAKDYGADADASAPTLRAMGHHKSHANAGGQIAVAIPLQEVGNNQPAILGNMAVRRLTPRECERLQGFPDDYTLVVFRGKLAADGNRYKALGNSMAVPVMRWLGERINMVDELVTSGEAL